MKISWRKCNKHKNTLNELFLHILGILLFSHQQVSWESIGLEKRSTHQDRDDGLGALHTVTGAHLDPVVVFGLAVQRVAESQLAGDGVQLEATLVARHQGVGEGPGSVGVGRAEGGDHLSGGQVLGHGVLVRHVLEGRRAVVLIQHFDPDLKTDEKD